MRPTLTTFPLFSLRTLKITGNPPFPCSFLITPTLRHLLANSSSATIEQLDESFFLVSSHLQHLHLNALPPTSWDPILSSGALLSRLEITKFQWDFQLVLSIISSLLCNDILDYLFVDCGLTSGAMPKCD